MENPQSQLEYWGLREQPFAPTADPSYFFATREHKECLFRLWSSIDERHGIAVVLGNYGTGKTALLRKLLTGMAATRDKYTTAVVASPIPSWTSFALLEAIVSQFGLHPERRSFVSYIEALNAYLLANRNRVCTLIIDDAQNLNKRGQLELLRLAQNLETHQHKLLNLVLLAQMEWMEVLRAAPNFEQRINMTYILKPIRVEETRDFIEFRIRQAGGMDTRAPSFDDPAIRVVHAYSQGNPRTIVTICRNSLFLACQLKTRRIGADIVLHTIDKTTLPDHDRRSRAVEAVADAPRTLLRTGIPAEVMVSEGASFQGTREQRAAALLLRAAAKPRNPL